MSERDELIQTRQRLQGAIENVNRFREESEMKGKQIVELEAQIKIIDELCYKKESELSLAREQCKALKAANRDLQDWFDALKYDYDALAKQEPIAKCIGTDGFGSPPKITCFANGGFYSIKEFDKLYAAPHP